MAQIAGTNKITPLTNVTLCPSMEVAVVDAVGQTTVIMRGASCCNRTSYPIGTIPLVKATINGSDIREIGKEVQDGVHLWSPEWTINHPAAFRMLRAMGQGLSPCNKECKDCPWLLQDTDDD
jgi:hypothetical protein